MHKKKKLSKEAVLAPWGTLLVEEDILSLDVQPASRKNHSHNLPILIPRNNGGLKNLRLLGYGVPSGKLVSKIFKSLANNILITLDTPLSEDAKVSILGMMQAKVSLLGEGQNWGTPEEVTQFAEIYQSMLLNTMME